MVCAAQGNVVTQAFALTAITTVYPDIYLSAAVYNKLGSVAGPVGNLSGVGWELRPSPLSFELSTDCDDAGTTASGNSAVTVESNGVVSSKDGVHSASLDICVKASDQQVCVCWPHDAPHIPGTRLTHMSRAAAGSQLVQDVPAAGAATEL